MYMMWFQYILVYKVCVYDVVSVYIYRMYMMVVSWYAAFPGHFVDP